MNYSQDIIWIMTRGEIMVNNNLNINLNSTVPLNSINYKGNQHWESSPKNLQDSTQDVTAGWRGDGGDEGAGDDDPDEVQRDDDDDGDDLPSSGRNFLGRFLPARELFSLDVFRPAEAAVSISDPP
jgi:hypothetical protein